MSDMWFIGTDRCGSKLAINERHVTSVREGMYGLVLCDSGRMSMASEIASVRCVNASEMLRFMRGEDQPKEATL